MPRLSRLTSTAVFISLFSASFAYSANSLARPQWTPAAAQRWYAQQPLLIGANYIPRTAINQLEMWQADTFDPQTIDQELGWAEKMGMNTMRVFLHNALWEEDPDEFRERINTFLTIAERHKIKPVFVLFDSCWDPDPISGKQHRPIPGIHNSGWVQAPGAARLADRKNYAKLESYVRGVIGSFAKDKRILAWDLWNEPNNPGGGNYPLTANKNELVGALLQKVYDWALESDPTQPVTSGVWTGEDWDKLEKRDAIERTQLTRSDINSFHDYSWPETFEVRARQVMSYGRPVLCTEYMARGNGSTFDGSLPIAKRLKIGVFNWGFVDGKSQTRFPWDSWERPYTRSEPQVWFHDILRSDGTPYRAAEVQMIKSFSAP